MKEKDLAALRPAEQTGIEIRAALARIADAKLNVASRIGELECEKTTKAADFSLDSAQRRKLHDQLEDLQQDIAQLDALETQVRAPLAEVEKVEREGAMDAERESIRGEMAELDQLWAEQYPELHAAIAALLEPRLDLARRIEVHNSATVNYLRPIELKTFTIPAAEVRLLKSDEERAEAGVPWHVRHAREQVAADAARRRIAAEQGPRVVPDAIPRPSLTVAGVQQAMPGAGW